VEGHLVDYLTSRKSEVEDMLLSEYNEAQAWEMRFEEGREEGAKKQLEKDHQQLLEDAANAVKEGALTVDEVSRIFHLSVDEVNVALKQV